MKLLAELNEEIQITLAEDTASGKKNYFIEGPFIQMDVGNRNKRIYPKAHVNEEIQKYIQERVLSKNAFGELGHPAGPTINMDRISHMIVGLKEDGSNYIGKAKIMDTPMGKIVKTFLDEGAKIGVSSRGVGTVRKRGGLHEVQNDFRLATAADIVADPSAPDAFVRGLMEQREWVLIDGVWMEQQMDTARQIIEKTSSKDLAEVQLKLFEEWIRSL